MKTFVVKQRSTRGRYYESFTFDTETVASARRHAVDECLSKVAYLDLYQRLLNGALAFRGTYRCQGKTWAPVKGV